MASLSSESSREVRQSLPVKFHPPRSFKFPRRKFGKGDPWLHYDVSSDSVFYHLCMTAAHEGKLLTSTKKDPAFLSKGYSYLLEGNHCFQEAPS